MYRAKVGEERSLAYLNWEDEIRWRHGQAGVDAALVAVSSGRGISLGSMGSGPDVSLGVGRGTDSSLMAVAARQTNSSPSEYNHTETLDSLLGLRYEGFGAAGLIESPQAPGGTGEGREMGGQAGEQSNFAFRSTVAYDSNI